MRTMAPERPALALPPLPSFVPQPSRSARPAAPAPTDALTAPVAPAPPAAPAAPAGPQACRVRLTPGPIAASQARRQVRAAIAAWGVPVDADIAVLLTSDLVTHAIRHAPGGAVTLAVRRSRTQLRVDVLDSTRPMPGDFPAATRSLPGLALLVSLAADWGCYQTPAGKAAYFTLELESCPAC